MFKFLRSSATPWLIGTILVFFFLTLVYGFILFLSSKGFTSSRKVIRNIGLELRDRYKYDDYFDPEKEKKIIAFLSNKAKKFAWIDEINIVKNDSVTTSIKIYNESLLLPPKLNISSMLFDTEKNVFKMIYPIFITDKNYIYIEVDGNIVAFLSLNQMTRAYVSLSLILFFLMVCFFYRQYLKLQRMINTGRDTENVLAEKSRTDEITARFARSVLLSGSMDEASLYAKETAGQLIGGEYVFAGYVDELDSSLNIVLSSSKFEEILGESKINKKITKFYGIWGKALSLGKSFYINSSDGEDLRLPGRNGDYNCSSILAVPAVAGDEVVGVITIANRKIPYTQADQKALERIAGLYAISIQKERAFLKVVERENQFRVAFKTNPDSVLITTFPQGRIVDVNDGFLTTSGYKLDDIQNALTTQILIWENIEDRKKVIRTVESEGKIINHEAKFYKESGKVVTGLISAAKIFLNGEPHMLSIIREIEKLKEVETELRKERAFLSKVVETSPAGIIAADGKTGKIIYANQRTAEIFNLEISEIKNRYIHDDKWDIRDFDFNKKDNSDYIYNIIKAKKNSLFDVRYTMLGGNDERLYISFNSTPIIGPDGEVEMFVVSLDDISQKVLTQKSLKEAKERLNSVIGSLPVILWAVNTHGEITLCRGMGLKPLGIEPDSLVGISVFDVFKKDLEILKLVDDGKKLRHFTKVIKVNGRYYEVTVSPIKDEKGGISGLSGVATDISRRVKMEEEQAILSSAIEQAAESIVITDNNGLIIYVNPAFENITGYFKDEVMGRNPNLLKSGYHNKYFYKDIWNHLVNGKIWNGYLKNRSKDGSVFEEEASISPVIDRSGEIQNFVAVKRDVTQERKMENQLRKAQKLEAIGTLAGGIAHDFNNILFPIIGFTELLLAKKSNENESKRYLDNILSAAYRAKELVHQILTFSRQNEEARRPLKVHVIVKEALKLLRASIPSIIDIKHNIETSEFPVMADATKIHQLIMNLGTNAYQAMENGGVLGIYVKTVDVSDEDIDNCINSEIMPGKYIRITVCDTGLGIPKNILERIFDPYFTTKPQGKGTGLGLSTVHGIVQSCKGYIKVYSEEGEGSSFQVLLPVLSDIQSSVVLDSAQNIKGGNENILVVDDEELIVEVIGDMLSDLGYNLTIRTSSVEALEAFKSDPLAYDLLVTDHTMPNMTGLDLTMEVHRINPGLPVIVCSGFSEIVTRQKAKSIGVSSFIMKPVLKTDLANSVRDALDNRKV